MKTRETIRVENQYVVENKRSKKYQPAVTATSSEPKVPVLTFKFPGTSSCPN